MCTKPYVKMLCFLRCLLKWNEISLHEGAKKCKIRGIFAFYCLSLLLHAIHRRKWSPLIDLQERTFSLKNFCTGHCVLSERSLHGLVLRQQTSDEHKIFSNSNTLFFTFELELELWSVTSDIIHTYYYLYI